MRVEPSALDLEAYLERVGYAGVREPSSRVLEALHLAHATQVPFENLDIHLGRPIRLDLGALQAKIVCDRRGGYCFEQNTLFAAALEALGFRVTRLAARVRSGATRVLPRTHMLLEVEADGGAWLCDVGFGGEGPLKPVPLAGGEVSRQYAWAYRVDAEGGQWVLRSRQGDGWLDLYAFTREPQYPVDFEMANHFTSTHPSSRFVQTITVQRATPEARYVLRGRELTVDGGGDVSRRVVEDGELLPLLAETFGLSLPAGTRLGPSGAMSDSAGPPAAKPGV